MGERTVVIDEKTIAGRVSELAAAVSRDYEGKDLVLVGVLKGAVIFLADLLRRLTIPAAVDFIHASSYGMGTSSSRTVIIKKDLDTDVNGRHVLLVDGIIDTGETLGQIQELISRKGPASVAAVVLLDKRSRRTVDIPLAYVGFEIPDRFVVGYGMDRAEQDRGLPYISAG